MACFCFKLRFCIWYACSWRKKYIKDFWLFKVSKLNPVFLTDGSGTITAANASSINDGAAAVLLASEEMCTNNKMEPMAKILAYAEAGVDSVDFTTAPACAVKKVVWYGFALKNYLISTSFLIKISSCCSYLL